jgi:hypothetical protein
MRRLIKVSFFALSMCAVLLLLLIAASVHTFNTLTDETLIAEIRFERTGERAYDAYLKTGDLCYERVYPILGDQWRIDAQFLKWRYWALLLGLDSQYRLERVEGRYRSVEEQNRRPALAHALEHPTAVDIVGVAGSLGPLNFLIDATYGTSTYQTIDTTRIHYVYKTPTGIFTRSAPRPTDAPAGTGLAVEINAGCGAPEGAWRRVVHWTDAAVQGVLGLQAGRR